MMGWFDWLFSKATPEQQAKAQDNNKLLADNKQALVGMEILAQKINAENKKDNDDEFRNLASQQAWRREGSGR